MTSDSPCVVAVVASAGGVEALGRVLAGLPRDLQASVVVQLHVSPHAISVLAQVLARHSALPVTAAEDGQALALGRVFVGVPDRHMLVQNDVIVLSTEPAEHGHRPSHDLLLRSLALAAGARAIGVVLTGLLSDGAQGLRELRAQGGTCVVQSDAQFTAMPESALRAVPDALQRPLNEVSQEIVRAVRDCVHAAG